MGRCHCGWCRPCSSSSSGAIHLDLYLTGYRHIPTIGWMFLGQVASAFVLAISLVATLPVADRVAGRLVAAAAAGFSLATVGGYLISLQFGMFGFHETQTQAGVVAGIVELVAFVLLGAIAIGAGGPASPRSAPILLGLLNALAIVLFVFAEAGGGAVSSAPPTGNQGATTGGSLTIVIKNFAFHPMSATVTAGERIFVKNEDSVTHTFTATSTVSFNTGPIPPGTTKEVVAPEKPGRYRYLCTIHRFMVGTLTVMASPGGS